MERFLLYLIIFLLAAQCSFPQDDDDEASNKLKLDEVNIVFKDNDIFSRSEIYNIIKTGSSEYYNAEEYSIDVQRIEKFYFDNGFIDAFIDTSTTINSKKNEISVSFLITANSPYLIYKVNYTGLENIPEDLRANLFKPEDIEILSGDRYTKSAVALEAGRVLRFLQNNGYAFTSMGPPEIVKYESSNPDLDYKLEVNLKYNTGARYRFGKTVLDIDNKKYKLDLYEIMYELEYKEDDIYSKEVLLQSENRLNRISILENTRIVLTDIDTMNNHIDFKIVGSIRNKYEIQPELLAYYISNSMFGGVGLTYSDKFFLKAPRTFSVKARALANSLENYRLELILELFQPHMFNNNKITGSNNLSTAIFSIDDYRIEEIKNKASINYELPKYTYLNNLTLDWNLKNQRVTFKVPLIGYDEGDTSFTTIPEGAFVNIFSSILGLTLVHSRIDNFQFPTSGIYQSFLVEESGLLGSVISRLFDISTVNYVKLSFINKYYLPITSRPDKSTIATKFLIGNIFEYGDNSLKLSSSDQNYTLDVVPIDSRFIAGGSTSVRGWNARKLGTFDGRENGGNFLLEGTIEHRTRPFYDMKGIIKDFGFVSFVDVGNLWYDINNFRPNDLAVAIGVGLRYYTIVGPIRLDFGFKFYDYEPAPGTNKWLWQNNVTQIFQNKFALQFGIGNTF